MTNPNPPTGPIEGFSTPGSVSDVPPTAMTYPTPAAMPPPQTFVDDPSGQPAGSPSTTDVAKDQAAGVKDDAVAAGGQVVGVAKEQAGQVAQEAGKQAKGLLHQARSEVTSQASTQQQRAASGIRAIGDEIRSMASGSDKSGPATDLAHQAAQKTHELADWLEAHEPSDLLQEVKSFAQRRSGLFLALAAGAGALAGRLTRGLTADTDDSSPAPSSTPRSSGPTAASGIATPPTLAGDPLGHAVPHDPYSAPTDVSGLVPPAATRGDGGALR